MTAIPFMVEWHAVAPWNEDGGWTIWTRGLTPDQRICHMGDHPEADQLARYIVELHNLDLRGENGSDHPYRRAAENLAIHEDDGSEVTP